MFLKLPPLIVLFKENGIYAGSRGLVSNGGVRMFFVATESARKLKRVNAEGGGISAMLHKIQAWNLKNK